MSWIDDLSVAAETAPHVVLTGSTWDYVVDVASQPVRAVPVMQRIARWAQGAGLRYLVVADPTIGLSRLQLQGGGQMPPEVAGLTEYDQLAQSSGSIRVQPDELSAALAWLGQGDVLGGMVVLDAARFVINVDSLSETEHALFTVASAHGRRARQLPGSDGRPLYPPIHWLCTAERDLPRWFVADPSVRLVTIEPPSFAERRSLCDELLLGSAQAEDAAERLTKATHEMSVRSLIPAAAMVRDGREPEQAATLVRLGVIEDRWTAPELWNRLPQGEEMLRERVKGQDAAVKLTWSVVQRSLAGLSGIHRPSSGRLPKAVLFLVGPTGTGKTELAKALAEVLFGDSNALEQFDMAGYSQGHSDQRLIGAPPGYTGHTGGGELTNRVRERPFSVLLFDEIEKAHQVIWDKFLSILQDGHIDDSLGRRVYFDQSVIVFTSNLGIYREEREFGEVVRRVPLVTPDTPYDEIRLKVTAAVTDHFESAIGRPELLNRIGRDNLVVFDFLRPGPAREVFDMLVGNVIRAVRTRHNRQLVIADDVQAALAGACCDDLSFGGRGIANKVESLLLNPLAHAIFPKLGDLPDPILVTGWTAVPFPCVTVQ